jgi:hypothetical protein
MNMIMDINVSMNMDMEMNLDLDAGTDTDTDIYMDMTPGIEEDIGHCQGLGHGISMLHLLPIKKPRVV